MPLGSHLFKYVDECCVNGGRIVRAGDKVNWEEEQSSISLNLFGEGPFTIKKIGLWPCGRHMLYVKGGKCDGTGIHASDFI